MKALYRAAIFYLAFGLISGIAGLGHIMLTIALVIFVVLLGRAIDSPTRTSEAALAN